MMNREKVIRTTTTYTETGYLSDGKGKFITHSFDDEPALICNDGTKSWYKDGLRHRDNNLPVVIYSDGDCEYYKNENRYWFINNEEYYNFVVVIEKFKNNILTLTNVNTNILKENNIVAIWLTWYDYIILDQSQYNLAIFKFL